MRELRELAKFTQLLKGTARIQIWVCQTSESWLLMAMQEGSPDFSLLRAVPKCEDTPLCSVSEDIAWTLWKCFHSIVP